MLQHLLRAAGAAFLIYIAVLAKPGSSLFSFHPVLMTIAFTGVMPEAIYVFSKYGLASRSLRSTRVTAHWLILGLAAVAHSIGYAVIYYNKEINDKPHYTSWHGLMGLVTSVLFWIQLCVGVFAKYPKLLESFMSVKRVRTNHALFGTLIFTTGMATMILALWSNWFATNASPLAFYGALVLNVALMLTTLVIFTKKYSVIS